MLLLIFFLIKFFSWHLVPRWYLYHTTLIIHDLLYFFPPFSILVFVQENSHPRLPSSSCEPGVPPLSPPPRSVRPPGPDQGKGSRSTVAADSGSLPRPALPPREALPRSISQQETQISPEDNGVDIPRSPSGSSFIQKPGGSNLNPFLPERPANPPPLSAAKTSSLRLKAQASNQREDSDDPNVGSSRDRSGLPLPKPPPPPPPQMQKKKSTNPFLSDSDEEEDEEVPPEIPFRNLSTPEHDGAKSLTRNKSSEADKPPVPAPRFYASGGVLPPTTEPGKQDSTADPTKAPIKPLQSSKKSRPPPPPSPTLKQGVDSRDASPVRVAGGAAPPKVSVVVSVLSSPTLHLTSDHLL